VTSSPARGAATAPDPQSQHDPRGIFLNRVGIRRVVLPLAIGGWDGESRILPVETTASVSLPADKRGIHMSRMLELFGSLAQPLAPASLADLLASLCRSQSAEEAELVLDFQWFIARPAPVSGKAATLAIPTRYFGTLQPSGLEVGYQLQVPVTTLCPCSRDISSYGAHSQRGWITARIAWKCREPDMPAMAAPCDVAAALLDCGSAPIYPLLKRDDERAVTMQAYENPAFVEDVARRSCLALRALPAIGHFTLEVCNEESIHTHDAFARYDSGT
jgi:GTP cyclohydrolase IB